MFFENKIYSSGSFGFLTMNTVSSTAAGLAQKLLQ
jgi:hypothetical protein